MTEHDRRAHVLRIEHVFDRHRVGAVPRQHFLDAFVNFQQTLGQRILGRGADDAALHEGGDAAVERNHTVPRDGGARIDPEHQRRAHASAIASSSISKLASTFCTSSSSSSASSNFMS